MSGEIRHKWNGTVLTITSDAGTSSADLKGQTGDAGIRGPQGRPGVILNQNGSIDFNGYATEDYVDYRIEMLEQEEPDLSNYYTKDEIDATLAEFQPSGGGGGGGSSNNATLTISNTAGWLSKTIPQGADCYIEASWNSTEDSLQTGPGVLTIYVGGIVKYTANVDQGAIRRNVSPYLSTGKNTVRVSITDVYGNTKSIIYTVNVAALTITSTFDATVPYSGDILYTYTPFGNVEKTVYFVLDGNVIGSDEVYTSGRQRTFTIPAQKHGAHTFKVYYESVIDGQTIPSNELFYDLICIEDGNMTPVIVSAFNKTNMVQFETVNIYYSVYDPAALTTDVVLSVNGVAVNNLTIDRTQQMWAYRADLAGETTLTITCGAQTKTIVIDVEASEIKVEAETTGLELYLTSYGRSNNEPNPDSWMYDTIECSFNNYNWKSDGWMADDNNLIVHRVAGDARLYIPLNVFGVNSSETGKTIEIEFATRDIMDYDAVIVSCVNGGIGFEMTAQKATLKSEQSEIFTQYKENEHIRLSFVIEKRAENRLIYTYLNGIMCGAVQYPDNDNFAQGEPVGITIGSNNATIDIYNIRVYNNGLTRYQIVENWIADTQDIREKLARYARNNVYDAYGDIVINNLPAELPYLILEAPGLPAYKDNPLPVDGSYIDPMDAAKCFTFKDATADVQGTSSAGYARKNYIIVFPSQYQLRSNSIPTNTFTFKADVASSEGANNVELVRLYNNICPYKTPPQLEDPRVRQGIDGFPIVIFHSDGDDIRFIGKYNFNNDKATPEVFGFAGNDESWEIKNNTSNRVLWKSADYSGTDWLNDFGARYPKNNKNAEKLAHFASWVVSTDTTGVSEDERAARLAKFRNEIEDYAVLDSALFYYLFTELFLMVDSRAKNAFPTWFEGEDKVVWLPYDMDTALGINNEGALTFGYELEDTDLTAAGKLVYNGQESVFWNNLRDAFGEEIKAMYQKLRSDKVLSYEIVEQMFEDHQKVWPEAIWNEDAWYKYLEPLVEDNDASYLTMLQGSKAEQRKWWLYNRFRYLDAKYNAGDAETDFITLRGYEKSDISVEPYADIYATIEYGSYLVQKRALRGSSYTLECPLDTLNDTEIYIYSASQLKSIGDISGLHVGYADFSKGTKLQNLKIGSVESDYSNQNLTELYLGNNTLLKTLDVRNCPNLAQSVDLSGCTNIEHIYFDGTAVKGCSLPNGGILKTLHLPATIANLTIMNQPALTDLSVPSYENITTLRLENVGDKVDIFTILNQMKANSRVRLINVDWTFATAADVETFYDLLDTMKGLDENNNNVDKVQISGRIHIPAITSTELNSLRSRYTHLTITYDSIAYYVYYKNYDGTLLYTAVIAAGEKAINPVALGLIPAPTKPMSNAATYVFTGWGTLPTITADTTLTAQYRSTARMYQVRFFDGSTLLETVSVAYGNNATYTGEWDSKWVGWNPRPFNITGNTDCYVITNNTSYSDDYYTSLNYSSPEALVAAIEDGTFLTTHDETDYMNITMTDGNVCRIQVWDEYGGNVSGGGGGAVIFIALVSPYKATFGSGKTWPDSGLRAKCQEIKTLLPAAIRNALKPMVITTETSYETYVDTVDYVWVPDYYEAKEMSSNAADIGRTLYDHMLDDGRLWSACDWHLRDNYYMDYRSSSSSNVITSTDNNAKDTAYNVRFMFAI